MENASQNDVEIMKQTILKQEAMFREQVYELHRLYQLQRLLMDKSKRKGSTVFNHSTSPPSCNGASSFTVFNCSTSPPCNGVSPFLFMAEKSAKERNFWELANEKSNDAKSGLNQFYCDLEQGFPFSENRLGNKLIQCMLDSSADFTDFSRRTECSIFDLELPAKSYMDNGMQENRFQKEPVSRTPSGVSCNVEKLEQQCNLQLSLGTGFAREIDVNDKGYDMLNRKIGSREAEKESTLAMNSPNPMEITFFPVAPVRNKGSSQHASVKPAQTSSKSVVRTLLTFHGESKSDDASVSKWRKTIFDEQERKEEELQCLEFEAGQDLEPMASSLMQSSRWHRAFPFLEMHNIIARSKMPLASEEKEMPTLFQENLTKGNARSNASGSFLRKSLGGGANDVFQLGSCKDDTDYRDSNEMYMHAADPVSLSSEFHEQLSNCQFPLKMQSFLHSRMSGTCDGSMQSSDEWPWCKQDMLSKQQSVRQREKFHFAGHEILQKPAHFSSADPPYQLAISNINKISENYENSPLPLISVSHIAIMDRKTDVELALELPSKTNTEKLAYSTEQARCLSNQRNACNNLKWERPFMKGLESQEPDREGKHSMTCSSPYLRIPCFKETGASESKVPVHVQLKNTCIEGATTTRSTSPDQSVEVMIASHLQKAVGWKMMENEIGATTVIGKGLDITHGKQEENASEDQNHGNKGSKESMKHHNADQKKQDLFPVLQNGYTLPVHCSTSTNVGSYSRPKGSNFRVAVHLAFETDTNVALGASSNGVEQRQTEACQEPGHISSESNLGPVFNEIKQKERGFIGLPLEAYPSSIRSFQAPLSNAEAPDKATYEASQSDNLCTIEKLETFVSLSCNNNQLESAEDAEAVELLLSLRMNDSSGTDLIEDNATCISEQSLDKESRRLGVLSTSIGATCHSVCNYREKMVMPEVEVDCQSSKQVLKPENLDFFESVTLMLEASGIATDEQNCQVVRQMEMENSPLITMKKGRSIRRGRIGDDFKKETLPSIASLSRREINKDLQIIGGLMRSVTNEITNRPFSRVFYKNDSLSEPTAQCSIKTTARTRGNICVNPEKAMKDKNGNQTFNGLPPMSSWGYATRRRRMRRHRSQLAILASRTSSHLCKEPIR